MQKNNSITILKMLKLIMLKRIEKILLFIGGANSDQDGKNGN